MNFQQAVVTALQQYAVFTGRASRSEYWYFVLFNFIVSMVLGAIGAGIASLAGTAAWISVLSWIWSLAMLVPSLAISVRRMHDIGKGGGWIFISLIPLVGAIWFIVLCCQPSEAGPNRFGNQPE